MFRAGARAALVFQGGGNLKWRSSVFFGQNRGGGGRTENAVGARRGKVSIARNKRAGPNLAARRDQGPLSAPVVFQSKLGPSTGTCPGARPNFGGRGAGNKRFPRKGPIFVRGQGNFFFFHGMLKVCVVFVFMGSPRGQGGARAQNNESR